MKSKSGKKHETIVKEPSITRWNARLRKDPKYKTFRLHKRVKHPGPPIPSWWVLVKKSWKLIFANKRNLLRFIIVFGVGYAIFVRGFSSPVDIDGIRDSFEDVLSRDISTLAINVTVVTLMLQSTTSAAGDVQGIYQTILLVMSTLALIWLYRQQQAGNKVTMKDAFYRGMYPIVPFVLILFLIFAQFIPASVGNYLFRTVIDNGLAFNMTEQFLWLLLFLLLLLLTFYMVTSSLVALFIVTLPDMTPKKALKKAKKLVQFRRLAIMRRIVALFLFAAISFVAIVFPAIFISALLAQFLFFALTIVFVPFIIAYLFVLYRELL